MVNGKRVRTLESLTYLASAEGMAKRVMNDFKKSGLTKQELAQAYSNGLGLRAVEYPNLVRLGSFLQELGTLSKSFQC